MTEVIMPKMGDGMEEGTLLEWLKKDGEKVKSGEVIGTIQTDKATLELEAPGSGFLRGILLQAGETVPVGKPIALLLKEGESIPASWGSGAAAAPAETAAPAATNGAAAVSAEPELVASAPASATQGRVKASPLAKKVAAELGIALESIAGSGPGGRIVEADVRSAKPGTSAKSPAPSFAPMAATAADTKVTLNRLRQITAQRTTQSKQQVPHFYVTVEVDLEKILALRELFEAEESGKVSINDFVVAATIRALQELPAANSTFQGDHLIQHGAVHIGIAAALDDGLMVPVVRDAHQLSLRQISVKVKELVGKARDGKLMPDEMSGSTFSISNMGMLNVENFAAIINQPNSGILAISSASRKVVATADDEIEIRSRMNITGSFDHRVLDGAVGAKFVNIVRDYLENPTRLLN